MELNDMQKAVAKIHGRSWADPEFRARFRKDPHAVLREHGLKAPDDLKIHVHEASATEAHWVIPARPADLGESGGPSADFCSIAPDYCSIGADATGAPHPNFCTI